MRFHKGIFPIRMIEGYDIPVDVVSGWINEDNTIGFHKISKGWAATDLDSGLRIYKAKTRKDCAEWINAQEDKIEQRKLETLYFQRVVEFREILRKELEKCS